MKVVRLKGYLNCFFDRTLGNLLFRIIGQIEFKTDCTCAAMLEENRSCGCEIICCCLSETFIKNLNISEKEEKQINVAEQDGPRNIFFKSRHPTFSQSPANKRKTDEEEMEFIGSKKKKQGENLKTFHDQKTDPSFTLLL